MPLNTKVSIVDFLTSIGEDSSFSNRRKIAEELGIKNYRGTAQQNKQLLEQYPNIKNENSDTTLDDIKKEDKKKLSEKDLKNLKKSVDKFGIDKVTDILKEKGIFDEVMSRLREYRAENDELKSEEKINEGGVEDIKSEEKIVTKDDLGNRRVLTESEKERILEEERRSNEPFYKREKERLTADFEKNIKSIDRLVAYSKTDLATNLAKTNKTFAKSMSNATNLYGRRGLLRSGIQKQQTTDQVDEFQKSIQNREEFQRRKEEGLEQTRKNITTQYQEGQTNINEIEDFQAYQQAIKANRQKQAEFDRRFLQAQQNIESFITQPTTPANKTYSEKDAKNKNLNLN